VKKNQVISVRSVNSRAVLKIWFQIVSLAERKVVTTFTIVCPEVVSFMW